MIKSIYKSIIPERLRLRVRQHLGKLTAPWYAGSNFYCNCCGKSFRTFLPKGNIKRENALCPYCGSLERTRLLQFYLQNETNLFQTHGLKVLHFAPETCLFKQLSRLPITYVDADINPALARHTIDITNIPYPENYFDVIICSHVLGHVPDEALAVQEMRRVLKPDGFALIMTLLNTTAAHTFEDAAITTPADRLQNYGEPDLCRLHGQDFPERLAIQGFTVEKIDYRAALQLETIQKSSLGNGEREIIFKCRKV